MEGVLKFIDLEEVVESVFLTFKFAVFKWYEDLLKWIGEGNANDGFCNKAWCIPVLVVVNEYWQRLAK